MKRNIIQFKDDNGNVFYPQTHEKAVIDSSGKSLDEKLADKQDKIDDLTSIRNGSSAGATAYQKPASGIPASDIASGVIPDVSGKQDTLVSGTNIKTVNGESILGSGNIVAGDPNAVKYVSQSLTDAQKAQARANIGAADIINGIDSVAVSVDNTSGSPEAEVSLVNHELTLSFYGLKGEPGVGFASVASPSTADGTVLITLTNGDTITLDLNHQHTQYPKYVYCATQAAYDAITTKESDTLYLILESN